MNFLNTKHIAILGFGVTGKALMRFCESQKIHHWIWEDSQPITGTGAYFMGQLSSADLTDDFAKTIFAILPSPGAPQAHPLNQWGMKMGLNILSDIEWAASFLNGEFIGVTGTNGKSTTVKLIDQLLNDAGKSCGLFGNYGRPLVEACSEPLFSHYVLEESSYQLELIQNLRHKISVCLNITEDHLDRYGDMANYRKAKERIFKNSTPNDFFIYNFDDYGCLQMVKNSLATNIPFSLVHEFDTGGFLKNNTLIIRSQGQEFIFSTTDCSLKGWHNMENMLAALICCLQIDCSEQAVASYKNTLKAFRGLPHRVEWVHNENGIDFYDDSKATNVNSVAMALTCFDNNVILIAGGRDKGGDYAPLDGLVKAKVKSMLLIGESQDLLFEHFSKLVETKKMGTLQNAVAQAKAIANKGDVVLLSPACSSFDQFQNYHERGLKFQDFAKGIVS